MIAKKKKGRPRKYPSDEPLLDRIFQAQQDFKKALAADNIIEAQKAYHRWCGLSRRAVAKINPNRLSSLAGPDCPMFGLKRKLNQRHYLLRMKMARKRARKASQV